MIHLALDVSDILSGFEVGHIRISKAPQSHSRDADFVSLKASLIKIFAGRLRIKEGYIFARPAVRAAVSQTVNYQN